MGLGVTRSSARSRFEGEAGHCELADAMGLAMRWKTERLVLRRWRPEDRGPFALLNADPRVMEFMPKTLSRTESDLLADGIEAHFEAHDFGLWAVEIPNEVAFAGFVGLSHPRFEAHFTPCVEVGWRLAASVWGRGVATEAASAAIDIGFAQFGLKEIVSFTVEANRRSWRVMEKLGMRRDPADDFLHPRLPVDHPLRPHILYRKSASMHR